MKTAVLLAGGGSAGIIQAGMIQELVDTGIKPNAVYGTSVGGCNGLMWYQDELDLMERFWLKIANSDVRHAGPFEIATAWSRCGFYNYEPLGDTLREISRPDLQVNPPWDFYVTATNMIQGVPESVNLQSIPAQDRWQWIWASASPPIITPPVTLKTGIYYCDGGVLSNINVKHAVKDGADELIILKPKHNPNYDINNIYDSIMFTLTVSSNSALQNELDIVKILNNCAGYRKVDVHVIEPDVFFPHSILDFDLGSKKERLELVQLGRDTFKRCYKAD